MHIKYPLHGYATSIVPFTLLRFLCGIGLGGAIPNVMALVAEYAPARKRSTLIAMTWAGFALGAVLGGMISVPLIAKLGWQSVFMVGGYFHSCWFRSFSSCCRNRSSS